MSDYRELLKKYMRGVAEWQCCDGLDHMLPSPGYATWSFTPDEIAELRALSAENAREAIAAYIDATLPRRAALRAAAPRAGGAGDAERR